MRLGLYTRLSLDPGGQTATARQEAACRSFAQLRGFTVAEVYEDVDVSAYQRGVVRPAFERLLLDVAAGRVAGVLAWKLDRLCRRPNDLERVLSVCEAAKAVIVSATEPIDTSSDLGLAVVRVLVTFASLESATIGLRLKARFEQDARAGKPPNRAVGYGHVRGYGKVVPREAAIIREAAQRVLAGEAIRQVCIDLNRRGVRTHTGRGSWDHTTLVQILRSARIAGHRSYKGELVARDCWPAIIDEDTFTGLQRLLGDPRRRPPRPGRRYLLSGLGWCGRCGGRLVGNRHQDGPAYKCPAPPSGCGGVTVMAHRAEAHVIEQVRRRLLDVPDQIPGGALSADQIEQLRQLARDHYVERVISRDEYLHARRQLEHRLNVEEGRLVRARKALEVLQHWEETSIDEQRLVVRSELSQFVVHRRVHPNRFDPARLELRWRTSD